MAPYIINGNFGIERKFAIVNHPAWLPVEWLSYVLIIWFIGHIIIGVVSIIR